MESIREIYKIGHGPSSSHTMGPKNAAEIFLINNKDCAFFRVTLYGSLAATGKGHMTDQAIIDTLSGYNTEIIWKPETFLPFIAVIPNTTVPVRGSIFMPVMASTD